MRVLVCGSRTFSDHEPIYKVLDGYAEWGLDVVIHGAAPGADSIAAGWCVAKHDWPSWAFPAEWDIHGRAAGFIRNQRMLVDGQPHFVWAFVDKPLVESRGTADMVRRSRDAGIPTYVVEVAA